MIAHPKARAMADKVHEWMKKNHLLDMCIIYVGNERWMYGYGGKGLVIETDINVKDYLDYCNKETISVVSEGRLYDIWNYQFTNPLHDEFDELLNEFGFYFEHGDAWNASAYEC
tara:strand:- start:223 stop:564 length:342 start_codon:yes stop_codon:yes gene_type:complete